MCKKEEERYKKTKEYLDGLSDEEFKLMLEKANKYIVDAKSIVIKKKEG